MKDGDISLNLTLDDKDFTVTVKNAGQLLSEMRRNLQTTAEATKTVSTHFNSFATSLRHTVMTLASVRFMMMDINDVFLTLPKSILKTSGEIERLTKLMEGLSKESTKAAREAEAVSNTKFIFDMARNAPYEVKSLSDAFVKFKSAGIDPTNGSLKALIDSVARFGGDSQQLHRASIAIQQMAGKGVISMEELRQQLGEAVPTAMQMMATGAGMSMQTLVNHISKGQVESKSALERMFAVMRAENDGAAAAMMTTWVGSLERFKTAWELAKVEMGKGGLFDTAKEEVNKLTDAFDGTQMREFSADIAFVTGQAAKGFAGLIEAVREYYGEIKVAGEIFIAAFAASKIASLGKGAIESVTTAYRAGMNDMVASINERNAREAGAHSMAIARSKQREAAMIEERALAQATYAQMNTDYNAMVMRRAALDREANKFKTAAYAELIRAQIAALEAEMLATKNNAIAHAGRAQALEAEIAAQRAHIVALEGTVVAQNQLTASGRAFAAMKGALGGIWTAIGGWVGLATIAITAGIVAWMDYAAAAERAAQRAKNAARGISDAAALASAIGDRDKTKKQVADWEDEKQSRNSGFSSDGREWTKADEDALVAAKKRLSDLQEEVKQHNENLEKDRVDHAVAVKKRENARLTAAITDSYNSTRETELKAIEDGRKEIEKKYAGDQKGLQAALDKYNKENEKKAGEITRRNEVSRLDSLRVFAEGQNRLLREELETASEDRKKVVKELIAENDKGIKELNGLIEQAGKIGTNPNLLKTKGDKGDKESDLEKWLKRVKLRVAELDQELNKEGTGKLAKWVEQLNAIKGVSADAKQELLKTYLPQLMKEEDIERGREFGQILEKIQSELSDTTDELNGGVTGINRMRGALMDLGAADPENSDLMGKIRHAMGLLDELEQKKSALSFRDLSSDLTNATAELNASLSIDPAESIYAKLSKDIDEYIKKIEKANLSEADAEKAREQLSQYATARAQRAIRDLETPLEKLGREWSNTTRQMQDASTRWAESTVDMLVGFTKTGKLEWRSLVDSIATDMMRITIKETLGKGLMSGISGVVGGLMGSGAGKSKSGEASGIGDMFSGIWKKITGSSDNLAQSLDKTTEASADMGGSLAETVVKSAEGIVSTETKVTAEQYAAQSLLALAQAAGAATTALGGTAASGGVGGAGGGGGLGGGMGLLGMLGKGVGSVWDWAKNFSTGGSDISGVSYDALMGMGDSVGAMTSAADSAAIAADLADTAFFANGGIMTEFGQLPLQKYARGGIANTPQAAIFGEGSMPEAYVPLPDGRSIPVTFSGATGTGGQMVNISIVVNNNGKDGTNESETSQNDQKEFFKGLGNQIKTVVMEQIIAQQRPGGVLYGH